MHGEVASESGRGPVQKSEDARWVSWGRWQLGGEVLTDGSLENIVGGVALHELGDL